MKKRETGFLPAPLAKSVTKKCFLLQQKVPGRSLNTSHYSENSTRYHLLSMSSALEGVSEPVPLSMY